jgi:hypothetical protein
MDVMIVGKLVLAATILRKLVRVYHYVLFIHVGFMTNNAIINLLYKRIQFAPFFTSTKVSHYENIALYTTMEGMKRWNEP